jgi:geranylgeranyl transferase type-2 subunit alpha
VKQALWMAPDDQSGWMYHRWLIADGDDPKALEREIKVIEELLEEEPESRCKCIPKTELQRRNQLFQKGCLNSLVHYKKLLLRHRPNEKDELVKQSQDMLRKLSQIDTMRKKRYADIGGYAFFCRPLFTKNQT